MPETKNKASVAELRAALEETKTEIWTLFTEAHRDHHCHCEPPRILKEIQALLYRGTNGEE